MSYEKIDQLLKKVTGVDSASRGPTMLKRALSERLSELGQVNLEDYYSFLATSAKELQALIDALMVTETWFYRDKSPFRFLSEYVSGEGTPKSGQVLQILSVPCATGEEPYSIAMALCQAGLARHQYDINALDISRRAIRSAKRAVYGKHAFRNKDNEEIKNQFFTRKKNGHKLNNDIKSTVTFYQVNFWQDQPPVKEAFFDIIFCRNLLIYFDKPSQQRAIKRLYQLLAPNGLLFVGHAESLCVSPRLFSSLRENGAFAYRKKPDAVANDENAEPFAFQPKRDQPDIDQADPDMPDNIIQFSHTQHTCKTTAEDEQNKRFELENAQRLIDEDYYFEAAILCRDHLQRFPDSAQAYFFLGMCYEQEGLHKVAIKLYRKAIRLEQDHYQALIHLSKLFQQSGDRVQADLYRYRAHRIIYGAVSEA